MPFEPGEEIRSVTADQTREVGRRLGDRCQGGEVFLLIGELGAGKTTLAQGIGAGLGVRESIVSPTFIVLREYDGCLPLYHFDFYNLEGSDRLPDVEFAEYQNSHGVCVMEWPEKASGFIPDEYLQINLSQESEQVHRIRLTAIGQRYETFIGARIGLQA